MTSTPLTPTGSKAEACQPLGAVRAACQRHGDKGAGILGDDFCGSMESYPHPRFRQCPWSPRKRLVHVPGLFPVRLSPSGASGAQRGVYGRSKGECSQTVLQSDKVTPCLARRWPRLRPQRRQGIRHPLPPGVDPQPPLFFRLAPSKRCHAQPCHAAENDRRG